MWGAGITVFEE